MSVASYPYRTRSDTRTETVSFHRLKGRGVWSAEGKHLQYKHLAAPAERSCRSTVFVCTPGVWILFLDTQDSGLTASNSRIIRRR
jgi:uncharacterized cupin superfamily protein